MPLPKSTPGLRLPAIGGRSRSSTRGPAWHTRLFVALQKGNAACLLHTTRVRHAADLTGESGWEEDIDDLLRDAAAAAAGGGFEW